MAPSCVSACRLASRCCAKAVRTSISRVSARTAFSAPRSRSSGASRPRPLAARVRRALGLPRRLVGGGELGRERLDARLRLGDAAAHLRDLRVGGLARLAQRRLHLRRRRRARAQPLEARLDRWRGGGKGGASRDASAIRWRQRSDCRSTVRRSCGAMRLHSAHHSDGSTLACIRGCSIRPPAPSPSPPSPPPPSPAGAASS